MNNLHDMLLTASEEKRKKKGWSVRKLCKKAGVSYNNYLDFRTHRISPSIDWVNKVLTILGFFDEGK